MGSISRYPVDSTENITLGQKNDLYSLPNGVKNPLAVTKGMDVIFQGKHIDQQHS